jgi:hypothetical protein
VRFFSSFVVSASMLLATVASAEAVTYSQTTISVPVSVSSPVSPSMYGTFTINVTCSSPKTASYSGVPMTTSTPVNVSTARLTFGPAQVGVPMAPGLQSGATVTCTLAVIPPATTTPQQFLSGVSYDSSKMTTQIVLP